MSEAARARERLEFEEAAGAVQKAKLGNERQASSQLLKDMSAVSALQITAGEVKIHKLSQEAELVVKTMYPKREKFQWRPAPILCKRFDLIDPFMGKAIFSDDSDDEENSTSNQVDDAEKRMEAANTTLDRLMAGDFLESLVLPDMPQPENKTGKRTAMDTD